MVSLLISLCLFLSLFGAYFDGNVFVHLEYNNKLGTLHIVQNMLGINIDVFRNLNLLKLLKLP